MTQIHLFGGGKSHNVLAVPLLVISIIIELYLLVNGQVLFGSQWSQYQPVLVIYLIMSGVLIGFRNQSIQTGITLENAIIYFVPVFILTTVLVGSIVVPNPNITLTYSIVYIIFQIFVVAFTEELMFRGILINYIGVIPQAIAFALFHVAAYSTVGGLNIFAIVVALVMGLLFGYIVKLFPNKGLAVTWAMHAGWNVAVGLGIFGLVRLI